MTKTEAIESMLPYSMFEGHEKERERAMKLIYRYNKNESKKGTETEKIICSKITNSKTIIKNKEYFLSGRADQLIGLLQPRKITEGLCTVYRIHKSSNPDTPDESTHFMVIDGESFTLQAQSGEPWIKEGDFATFYYTSPKQDKRYIIKGTFEASEYYGYPLMREGQKIDTTKKEPYVYAPKRRYNNRGNLRNTKTPIV